MHVNTLMNIDIRCLLPSPSSKTSAPISSSGDANDVVDDDDDTSIDGRGERQHSELTETAHIR